MLYFLASDAMLWTSLAVLLLLCAAAGIVATVPGRDRRAGRGARHRRPGPARVTPSGTYPRRRAEQDRELVSL